MKLRQFRISLSSRIFLSFFILILAFTVNAIITYITIDNNISISNKIFNNSNPSLQNLERFKLLVNESKMFSTNWVFLPAKSTDKKQLLDIHQIKYPEQREKLQNLASQWYSNQGDSLKSVFNKFEKLLTTEKRIISLLNSFEDYEDPVKKMESEFIIEDEILPITENILNSINSLIEDKKLEITKDEAELVNGILRLRIIVIVLSLLLILLALAFSLYTSRYISKPIIKIKNIINNLGLGIINEIHQPNQKDEIADIINSVNNLSQSLLYTSSFANEIGKGNFEASFKPLSDEDTLGKSLLTMRDNLQKTEAKLHEAQELTSNGSWEYDLITKKLVFSKISYKIIQWDLTDENPQIIEYLKRIHPEDLSLHLDKINKATQEGISQTYDLRIILPNKSIKNIQKIVKPIKNEAGEVVKLFGTILDIDERKKFELDLIQAKNDAEQATRVKSLFLSNMSHEMRTPMNAIIGLSDLLVEERLDTSVLEKIYSIKHSGENLLKIINEILDFSKVEAGKITLEQIDFDLEQVLEGVIKTLDFKAKAKGLIFNSFIEEGVPKLLVGDPYRLNQILLNLVGNAIKFTASGSVKIEVKLKIKNDTMVVLNFAVIDTGIGIAEDKQHLIFESFSQAQNDHSRKYGGTGLGLSITKKLIELMGGELNLTSKDKQGSHFYFSIQYKIGDEKIQNKEDQPELINHLDGISILLVEDNAMNQFVAFQILKKWNVIVESAINGKHALALLEKKEYDIILMDLQMPEMDGYETTELIRNPSSPVLNHRIPIVAVSADAFTETKERALALGMNEFITKPINKTELFNCLNKLSKKEGLKKQHTIKPLAYSEIINLGGIIKIAEGNIDFVEEILKLYLMELPVIMLEMRNFASESNWYAIVELIPKLKSIVSNLGLTAVRENINSIESICLRKEQLDLIPILIEELALNFETTYVQLHEKIKKHHL
ncbi:MAG TPA: ATP-binding protein [Bacteroidia bacterium]|nr:ATP-binding protein [Bacteroidia bacterium]